MASVWEGCSSQQKLQQEIQKELFGWFGLQQEVQPWALCLRPFFVKLQSTSFCSTRCLYRLSWSFFNVHKNTDGSFLEEFKLKIVWSEEDDLVVDFPALEAARESIEEESWQRLKGAVDNKIERMGVLASMWVKLTTQITTSSIQNIFFLTQAMFGSSEYKPFVGKDIQVSSWNPLLLDDLDPNWLVYCHLTGVLFMGMENLSEHAAYENFLKGATKESVPKSNASPIIIKEPVKESDKTTEESYVSFFKRRGGKNFFASLFSGYDFAQSSSVKSYLYVSKEQSAFLGRRLHRKFWFDIQNNSVAVVPGRRSFKNSSVRLKFIAKVFSCLKESIPGDVENKLLSSLIPSTEKKNLVLSDISCEEHQALMREIFLQINFSEECSTKGLEIFLGDVAQDRVQIRPVIIKTTAKESE